MIESLTVFRSLGLAPAFHRAESHRGVSWSSPPALPSGRAMLGGGLIAQEDDGESNRPGRDARVIDVEYSEAMRAHTNIDEIDNTARRPDAVEEVADRASECKAEPGGHHPSRRRRVSVELKEDAKDRRHDEDQDGARHSPMYGRRSKPNAVPGL